MHVCLAVLVATLTANAQAPSPLGAAEIEARVRQIYFEGYPSADGTTLTPQAVSRLAEMLVDPAEQEYWANIVLALGASGNPAALAPLADFAASEPSGEVSGDLYAARVSLRVALGRLAHDHPPAMELLASLARDQRSQRAWHFQTLRGAKLSRALQRSAITGLAVSGRPEAVAVFDELHASGQGSELSSHIEASRPLHARSAQSGPESVLRPERDDSPGDAH